MLTATVGFTGDYELQNWSNETLPNGTTEISPASGPADQATFNYDLELISGGFSREQTVDFFTTAVAAGSATIDYEFTGNSRFFGSRAIFSTVSADVSTGVVDSITSGRFSFTGTETIDTLQGEEFGFRIGGRNADSNREIFGDLLITRIEFSFDGVVVDSLSDIDDGDYSAGNMSLREAVRLANTFEGIDTITFDEGLAGETIVLTEGQLDLTEDVTIAGLGADRLAISGGGASRIFSSTGQHEITIEDVTLTDGDAAAFPFGGALLVQSGVEATLRRVTVQDSTTEFGAAVRAVGSAVNVVDSSIVNNLGTGPAIDLRQSPGRFETSTISGNAGIGIRTFTSNELGDPAGELLLSSVTVANNAGGGVFHSFAGGVLQATYQNSLLADNGGAGNFGATVGSFDTLNLQSLGNNLLDDTPAGDAAHAAGPNDQRDTDPLLGPLQDNGGPTPTHALLVGSPAIDAGSNSTAPDQRGFARPADQPDVPNVAGGVGTDIGAFELRLPEAPSFVVDTTVDLINDRDQQTSLREAVLLANATPGLDTITFDASLADETILLTEGDLTISDSITVQGLGADRLTVSAGGASRIFNEVGNGQRIIEINDITLADGASPGGGGGALFTNGGVVTFNRVVMIGNSSQNNGTAVVVGFGRLTINDSAIVDNLSAGIGAVRVQDSTTVITNTTISGNDSRAISLFSSSNRDDSLSLINVTIANNAGDAIEIVANTSTVLLEYENTIFADDGSGNGNGRERIVARGNNLAGLTIRSLGHNLLQEAPTGDAAHDAAVGDLRDVDALLLPLADNGGPTPTHALGENSPAIDAGNSTVAADQRGVARPADLASAPNAPHANGSDIGAFESYDSALALPGDYNLDGNVDLADYTVWRDQLGSTAITPRSGADGDGDGVVGEADYDVWSDNFGSTLPAAAAPALVTDSIAVPPNVQASTPAEKTPSELQANESQARDLAFALVDQPRERPAPRTRLAAAQRGEANRFEARRHALLQLAALRSSDVADDESEPSTTTTPAASDTSETERFDPLEDSFLL
ncbi:MAG: choice-of-anchor Q domain-containing protein [Planctomycetota bacterium]